MAKLILKFKDKVIKEYPVSSEAIRIGRLPDNHIVIDNPAVSKHHAAIEMKEGIAILTDLNSTNGTFLNDKKIQEIELKNGDNIIIGKHTLIYESEQEQPDAAKPFFGDFGEATMILDTKRQKDLLAKQKQEAVRIEAQGKQAKLVIIEPGGQEEYKIKKDAIVIGKSHTADVMLKGLLIPPIAATIRKEGDSFYISGYGGWISVTVNGSHAGKNLKLNNNDIIEIRNYKIKFRFD
ncbi:MAG: FHA domain-containing protein [Nitrospinae bacterium]|nr:FHA domain-containing protein [Nitrospinota bacterium]MBI3814485.1 FHA domain-containing protein [Nitrospinota bacterium]